MQRPKFYVVALMVAVAMLAGGGVALLVPSMSPANAAADLALVPPPPASSAVMPPSFADLADRAVPSVVAITSQKVVEARDPHEFMFDNPFFRRFFRGEPFGEEGQPEGGAPQERPQQRRQRRQWGGSGFFITTDGYILTNKHVVEEAEKLFVRTSEMAETDEGMQARLIGTDPYLDLALIKVDGRSDWPALALGDSEKLRVGEWTVAIGNPIIFRNSVTVGVVSGKGRRIGGDATNLGNYIQTDAAINFGNSGGPLLNARGEVIGINTAIIREDGSSVMGGGGNGYIQGIGFALPISPVKRVLDQLAGTGTVKRGYLGVSVQPVDGERAEYYKVPQGRGAYVARVDKDTPAYKAGVRQDDVILSVDGKAVNSSEDLVTEISAHAPGDKVRLAIWRDGREQSLDVTLAERTIGIERAGSGGESGGGEQELVEESATALGFSVGPLPATLRQRLAEQDPPLKGVLVTDVDPNSSASAKGLEEGQVLLDVNRQPTPSVEAYKRAAAAVKPGEPVRVRVLDSRSGDEVTLFFRAPGKK
jgi:serine protease Do